MLNRSLVALTLTFTLACAPGKGQTGSESGSESGSQTGSESGSDTDPATGTTRAPDAGDTGVTPTTGDVGDLGECPALEPTAAWAIEFMWNDDGPPGFEPGEFEDELREAPCTVTAVGPGPHFTLGLACTYASESEPRAHDLKFSVPPGFSALKLAVDDAVELEYHRVSGFEQPTAWHLELRRDGVTVLAATDAGDTLFDICEDAQLVEDFSEFALALVHGACGPLTSDRLEFTIDGITTALSSGTAGPLSGGYVGVVEEAYHEVVQGGASCSYKVLVFLAGG